jgi:hypothetical protein
MTDFVTVADRQRGANPPSYAQNNFIKVLSNQLGLQRQDLDGLCMDMFGKLCNQVTKDDAIKLITHLRNLREVQLNRMDRCPHCGQQLTAAARKELTHK